MRRGQACSHSFSFDQRRRDPRELEREGRVPGAFHCPRGMLEFWIDPASPYHKPVFAEPKRFLFYCASGWRSALAARTAQEMGLPTRRQGPGGQPGAGVSGGMASAFSTTRA